MSLIHQLHPHLLDKEAMADILVLQNLLKIFPFPKIAVAVNAILEQPHLYRSTKLHNILLQHTNRQAEEKQLLDTFCLLPSV